MVWNYQQSWFSSNSSEFKISNWIILHTDNQFSGLSGSALNGYGGGWVEWVRFLSNFRSPPTHVEVELGCHNDASSSDGENGNPRP